MFSMNEKRKLAEAVEKLLLDLNHPEMPKEKPEFTLSVNGKEDWSWAEIGPNWKFDSGVKKMGVNPWNEVAREVMESEDE